MNADITMRVRGLMSDMGYDQTRLAEACGLTKFTISRYMNDKTKWSDNSLHKISAALGVSFRWLRDGIGDMLEEINHDDAARHDALEKKFDAITAWRSEEASDGGAVRSSVNTIHGDNNTGTQTINSDDGHEREMLLQKVAMLEKMVADKDKEVHFLRGLLSRQEMLHSTSLKG